MDLVTQGLLGACVGHAVAGRQLGGRALALGAVAGLLPDGDALWVSVESLDYWRYHRGITHSIIAIPFFAVPLAFVSHYLNERTYALNTGTLSHNGMTAARWYAFWLLTLITHPLLDSITHWGTMLFAPLSNIRYGISALPIIDIVYSLTLITGIVFAFRRGIRTEGARFAVATALVASSAWIAYGYLENTRAKAIAKADAQRQGIAATQIHTYTTLLTPWFRRVVATTNSGHHVGFVSTLAPRKINWREIPTDPAAARLEKRVRATEAGDVYRRFAVGPVHAEIVTAPQRTARGRRLIRGAEAAEPQTPQLRLYDMRYGTLGGTIKGFWGMSLPASIAAEGTPEAITRSATQFMRRPSISGAQLAEFFRATFGLKQDTY